MKVRAVAFDYHCVGNSQQDFVHVTVKILSGRSLDQRKKLANLISIKLSELFSQPISLTVEVSEIEKESYVKVAKPV